VLINHNVKPFFDAEAAAIAIKHDVSGSNLDAGKALTQSYENRSLGLSKQSKKK